MKRSSVLFTATIGGPIRDVLCADNGSDVSLMDDRLLKKIQDAGADVQITELCYSMVAEKLPNGESAEIVCKKLTSMHVELHVRHGATLVLRNLTWVVTAQHVCESLLGRPVLEALGLNTSDILGSAADRFEGNVHISAVVQENDQERGKLDFLLQNGVFYADRGVDHFSDDDTEGWLDLGEESPEEKTAALSQAISNAEMEGSSESGKQKLSEILVEYDDVLRLRLGTGHPADVEPMRIHQRSGAIPVRARQGRHPEAKLHFMERYVDKLTVFGFVRTATNTEWFASPLIVPKHSRPSLDLVLI